MECRMGMYFGIEKDAEPSVSVVKVLKMRDGSPLDVPIMQFACSKEVGIHVYLREKPKEEKEKEIIRKDPSNQSYYIIGNLKQLGL